MTAETDDLLHLAERCGLPAPAQEKLRTLVDTFRDADALAAGATAQVTEAREQQSRENFQVYRLEEEARAGHLIKVRRQMVRVDRPGGVENIEEITREPDLEIVEAARKKQRAADDELNRRQATAAARRARCADDGNVLNTLAIVLALCAGRDLQAPRPARLFEK